MANFARIKGRFYAFENIAHAADFFVAVDSCWVCTVRPVFAKVRGYPIWPVKLIHINIVGM